VETTFGLDIKYYMLTTKVKLITNASSMATSVGGHKNAHEPRNSNHIINDA
jgi:hypothetical protein